MEAVPGAGLKYRFRSVKLLDWQEREKELLNSWNPFENLIAIYLKSRQTIHDPNTRLQNKQALFDHFVERGWEQDAIAHFYLFLDRVMRLPKDLELHYHDHIKAKEKEKQMSYITSAEQIGIEKGLQQGMQAGVYQTKRENAKKMMQQGASYAFVEAVTGLTQAEVEAID